MNLEELYNASMHGIQTWSDKKLHRAFLPAFARALGGRAEAGINANAGIQRQGIASQGGVRQQEISAASNKDIANIKNTGDTHRTSLTTNSNILMRRLMEAGGTKRQEMVGEQGQDKLKTKDFYESRMLRDFPMRGTAGGQPIGIGNLTEEELVEQIKNETSATLKAEKKKGLDIAMKYRRTQEEEDEDAMRFSTIEGEMYTPGQ